MDGDHKSLIELLDIYQNLIEEQNKTINDLTKLLTKQAMEIEQLKAVDELGSE